MPLFFKRKLSIFVLTFSLLILAEMTVFLIIFQTPYANFFFLEIGIYVLLLSRMLLFKNNKIAISYSATILSLILLLFAVNVTLDYASRDIFTFAYLKQAGEAVLQGRSRRFAVRRQLWAGAVAEILLPQVQLIAVQ